jgi:ribosome production factor 1
VLLYCKECVLTLHVGKKRLAENVPRTLDNMRELDPLATNAEPSSSTSGGIPHDESPEDITDPFESYFSSTDDPTLPPKVLVTTSPKATKATYHFCDELVGIFPGGEFIRRKKGRKFDLDKVAGWAADRGYKHMFVVNEDMKKPSTFTLLWNFFLSGLTNFTPKMPSHSFICQMDQPRTLN